MRKTVDMLLENGRIYTMVSEGDCVEALCVKDGVIVYTARRRRPSACMMRRRSSISGGA